MYQLLAIVKYPFKISGSLIIRGRNAFDPGVIFGIGSDHITQVTLEV